MLSPEAIAHDREHRRLVLDRLVDLGASIAQVLHDDIAAAESTGPRSDLAQAFAQVARTVRRTILLAEHLEKPASAPRPTPFEARKRVIREVEDAINVETLGKPEKAEALRRELLERLETPEFSEDLATRPLEHIIAEICRDLDVFRYDRLHLFKRRTPQDLENLAARAAGRPRPHPEIDHPYDHPTLHPEPAIAVAQILGSRRP